MHTATSILVLLVLAGLVASLGDRVGRVAAKRKVALFGLRPRLAAACIAVLTGVLIAGLTLGFLSLVSRDVREMLFHFDELKRGLTALEAEVDALERNRRDLTAQRDRLGRDLDSVRSELESKEQEATALVAEISRTEQRRLALARELTAAEQRLGTLEEQVAADVQRLSKLRTQLEREEASNTRLRQEREDLQQQVTTLNQTYEGLLTEAGQLEERIEALRAGNIVVEVNQPLAYIPIPAQLTLPESQRKIVSTLGGLQQRFEAEGVGFQPVPPAAMTELLNTLSLLTEDVIVVVYSERNVLPGEAITVTFEIAPDQLVFRKGDLIVRINVAAEVGREQLPALFANAFAAVRAVALSRGMLPDLETGEVGSISASDIARAAEQVERVKGKRILEIRAGRDFSTTDTLDSFEFVVKPAKD